MIEQTTVMIENKPGRLADVLSVLSAERVDLNGISIADSADFGVLRMILSSPGKGSQALATAGFLVKKTQVLAVEVPDKPGALQKVLACLYEGGVNIQYVYAFGTKALGRAMIILKPDEGRKAEILLSDAGFTCLSQEDMEKRVTL